MRIPESEYVIVPKGWGREIWYYNGPNYCGKRLEMTAGKKCSMHYHKIKDEVLLVHSGKIVMLWYESEHAAVFGSHMKVEVLGAGQSFHVPPGLRHQMIAAEDTVIYEFSTHHEDSDSIKVWNGDKI